MRFLLVDEILEMVPGSSIRAIKTMDPAEELFRDHFPGFPVVPGVILTEMMAQAAGKCLLAEAPERGRPVLAQIQAATFRRWVRPGQQVMLIGSIQTSRPLFATASCRAETEGQVACSATLMFTFLAKGEGSAESADDVLDRFLRRQGSSGGASMNT